MKIKLSLALLLLTLASAGAGDTSNGLSFLNDNFPKALAAAKQRKLPIFVEVWAPW